MCGRHHKLIDTEFKRYTVSTLLEMKAQHEERGIAEISPVSGRVATQLLANYTGISVVGNNGNVAIQSPGAIQANSITIKNTKMRLSVAAPTGSLGASQPKVAYCQHLIDRYQDYQKSDWTGKTKFKYIAIHNSLKRTFGVNWKLLSESKFEEVVVFLQGRIDATIIGKGNKKKGIKNFSSHEEWQSEG